MIASVNTDALLRLMWAAPLAVLIVTIAWGVVIRGATRAFEAQRDRRSLAAGAHALVAAAGFALFVAAIVAGLLVMLSKD